MIPEMSTSGREYALKGPGNTHDSAKSRARYTSKRLLGCSPHY